MRLPECVNEQLSDLNSIEFNASLKLRIKYMLLNLNYVIF